MLCKKTIKRIIKNSNLYGVNTVIGKYTYSFNNYTGYIYHCKTEYIHSEYIDTDGTKSSAWEFVAKV